jgi:imidazolonepropionase-like amidohydrolase
MLVASTRDAAAAIGLGHETGSIAPGLSADVLLVDGDPFADISILQDKNKLRQIIVRGRVMVDRS